MKMKLIISFFASFLCFLITFWPAKYSIFAEGWTQSVCYFVLTYILLDKYSEERKQYIPIVLAIIAGRFLIEIPIRIIDFYDSLFSFFVPIIAISSIILSAICYKEKRIAIYIMAVIIVVLLNTVVHYSWYHYIRP